MDVKKALLLGALSLLITNCDQRAPAANESNFRKAGSPGCEDQSVKGEYLVHWKDGSISIEHSSNDEQFIDEFLEAHRDEILSAEPHYRIQIENRASSTQEGVTEYPNWGVDVIGASEVWRRASSESSILVAVIDSGVDINHPELADAIYQNSKEVVNGEDDDGNGLIDDVSGYDFVSDSGVVRDYTGHGTHVSGTIVAQHDVGRILGVAPNVKLLPIAFISRTGGGSVSAAIDSIRYAVEQKANVINASWGGESCSTLLLQEIQALAKDNILFVSAAGNSAKNLSFEPEYPAAFEIDNMITVGASSLAENSVDQIMASFTNFGSPVDLVAPGNYITSTYPAAYDDDGSLDGIATIGGTSMAAPHVAGAAALLWSLKPAASYGEIKRALLRGVRPGPFRVETRGSLYLPEALRVLEE